MDPKCAGLICYLTPTRPAEPSKTQEDLQVRGSVIFQNVGTGTGSMTPTPTPIQPAEPSELPETFEIINGIGRKKDCDDRDGPHMVELSCEKKHIIFYQR